MFKKTLTFIFILSIVLLSIGSIYAEDSTDAIENTTKTFTDLSNEINNTQDGEIINISGDYKYNSTCDEGFKNGSVISKNLTIVGVKNATVDGAYIARGLYIEHNCNVILKDIIFKNCYSNSSGAAINLASYSNLTVINCTFLNNTVYNSDGGAIMAQRGTNMEINRCLFSNNTSIRVSDLEWKSFKRGMGSAVKVTINSTLRLIDTVFKNNNAYLATVLVVSYNDVDYAVSKLYVENCSFVNNTSQSSGAIYLDELGIGEFYNTTFRDNKVTGSGGTLVLDACISAVVDNCSFINNDAVKGGAIQIKVFEYDYRSNVVIRNCNFSGNRASEQGGAVYAKYGLTKIINSSFSDNYCTKGGAIYAKYASLEITGSRFSENSADYGGALFLRTDNNYINNNIFTSNAATQKGGAIYSKIQSAIDSNNCVYTKNVAVKGSDVYGLFNAKITMVSSYFGGAEVSVKLTSPWKMPLNQMIKLTFKGSKTYKTSWMRCDGNGVLSFKVPLDVGKYTVSVSLESGVCYDTPVINVIKAPADLTIAKKVTVKYGKIIKFYVKNTKTNKFISNAKLILKVYSGKKYETYKLTADKNGLVQFDTSKLSTGTYKVKITSQNSNIKLSKKQVSFKIKKASAKVSSSKKVKKPSKIKIYIKNKVSNKAIAKTKFTVKVQSKNQDRTFILKTNSKGLLKIPTKNLMRGSYKITISLNSEIYKIKNKCKIRLV